MYGVHIRTVSDRQIRRIPTPCESEAVLIWQPYMLRCDKWWQKQFLTWLTMESCWDRKHVMDTVCIIYSKCGHSLLLHFHLNCTNNTLNPPHTQAPKGVAVTSRTNPRATTRTLWLQVETMLEWGWQAGRSSSSPTLTLWAFDSNTIAPSLLLPPYLCLCWPSSQIWKN